MRRKKASAFIGLQLINNRNKSVRKETPIRLHKDYFLRVWMIRLPLQSDDSNLPALVKSEAWDGKKMWVWVFSPDSVVFDERQKEFKLSNLSVLKQERRTGDFVDFGFVVHDVIQKTNNDRPLRGKFVNLMVDVGYDRSIVSSFRLTSRIRK